MLLNQGNFERNFFFFFSRVSNRPLHFVHLGFCKSEAGHLKKESKQLSDSSSEADDNSVRSGNE